MKETMYRITWRDKQTGETGHGEWNKNADLLTAWVVKENREWPEIIHTVESNQKEKTDESV